MRRSNLNGSNSQNNHFPFTTPSVPPAIRHILQIPETPAPVPRIRGPQRRAINGRRGPPGPPPPRSWVSLAQSRHAPPTFKADIAGRVQSWPLSGAYAPGEGTLVDMVLRRMALDWEQQRDWNRYYLYTLPSRLRTTLLGQVAELYEPGVSIKDLRLVLTGPFEEELAKYDVEKVDAGKLNADVFYLDLTGSLGKSLTLKELSELLHPPKADLEDDIQESWDEPELTSGPAQLLPNLTHLSLAVDPGSNAAVSWKQLLSLAGKMSQLTHLNLAGWPEPSLTPNAKFAKVTSSSTGRTVQYGGTGPYSHNLDGDWSEAIMVLKRLSKALYGLEYLDLTGCADWSPALMKESDGDFTIDFIDWVGDWGKVATLRLNSGYALTDNSSKGQIMQISDWIDSAAAVEKHIRAQRSGRGRWITVERDTLPDSAKTIVENERLRAALVSAAW
ncbi:Uu.00g053830.m01.CDS01 [Anthostomella pinea]|uniref:Uu.00g053830.m01.CDS01 n=1 Tax=Anthostomella pinea TaxID=933095 RepID=A0AAI8VWJ9_9PEZI|nr:Uu.00g053830.m01.CDS01 [Anthostomella pinea]